MRLNHVPSVKVVFLRLLATLDFFPNTEQICFQSNLEWRGNTHRQRVNYMYVTGTRRSYERSFVNACSTEQYRWKLHKTSDSICFISSSSLLLNVAFKRLAVRLFTLNVSCSNLGLERQSSSRPNILKIL
jgi:hypothetical protein